MKPANQCTGGIQQIFGVGPLLGDVINATDLADLFTPGNLHETPRGK